MLRDCIVCRINNTGGQWRLLAEPDITLNKHPRWFRHGKLLSPMQRIFRNHSKGQIWQLIEQNRHPHWSPVKVLQQIIVVQTALAANAVEDSIWHLNASIDRRSVTGVRRKATWLKSSKVDDRHIVHLLARNFKLDSKAELIYLIRQSNPVMNLTHTVWSKCLTMQNFDKWSSQWFWQVKFWRM